jgi:hypothetical protein
MIPAPPLPRCNSLACNSVAPENAACDFLAGLAPNSATGRLALVSMPRTADAGSHFGEQDLLLNHNASVRIDDLEDDKLTGRKHDSTETANGL